MKLFTNIQNQPTVHTNLWSALPMAQATERGIDCDDYSRFENKNKNNRVNTDLIC